MQPKAGGGCCRLAGPVAGQAAQVFPRLDRHRLHFGHLLPKVS